MIKTKITEMLNIDHPIVQGGMHYVGFAEMAAAVSNAGGLGIITGLTQPTPDDLAKEIARCHEMTDKPFGVNLTFLPGFAAPDYPGYIKAIIEGGIKIVETAGRSPEAFMPPLKEAGIKLRTRSEVWGGPPLKEYQSICSRYEKGENGVEIARTYNVSAGVIYRILDLNSIQRRKQPVPESLKPIICKSYLVIRL